ncbi:MAG TPA: hypothetical protein PK528_12855 [Syntrophorhabdus sp.]|jgi:hypothetical protein|nr:hypothetical protein [Syntrophorhabdus sp.]
MARYDRFLCDEFLGWLSDKSKLNFLITEFQAYNEDHDPFALDMHIREKNELNVYHGGTRVLAIRKEGVYVRFSAHRTYGKDDLPSGKDYKNLMRNWDTSKQSKLRELKDSYGKYLRSVVKSTNPRFYRKEGYWANRLSIYFGLNWKKNKRWLVFDREAVIGFDNQCQKDAFYNPKKEVYGAIESELRSTNQQRWGQINGQKEFGDELDMLAIGPDKELLCIELKFGENAKGIYWGPLQVSVYRDAFRDTKDDITASLKKLLQQKIELGLLPEAAKERVPEEGFAKVDAILAIAERNPRSSSWSKMKEVQSKLTEKVDVALIDGSSYNPTITYPTTVK